MPPYKWLTIIIIHSYRVFESQIIKGGYSWKFAIRRFQKATFLGFQEAPIKDNNTGYSDEELKLILKEYYYLFVQPTLFYLKEFF